MYKLGIVAGLFLASAPVNDTQRDLGKLENCMLSVLKETPGVTEAKLGHSNDEGWSQPFLEYRAAENARWTRPSRFNLQKPSDPVHGPFWFEGMFPGMVAPGEKGPDIHVTDIVVRNWKTRCGVSAEILFE